MIQNRPDVESDAQHHRQHVAERPIAEPAAQRLIAEAELVLDDVAGIKRQRQRDQHVEADHDARTERQQAKKRLSARPATETGEPGVDRPGENERHQRRETPGRGPCRPASGERNPAVTAGLGLLIGAEAGRRFLNRSRAVFDGWNRDGLRLIQRLTENRARTTSIYISAFVARRSPLAASNIWPVLFAAGGQTMLTGYRPKACHAARNPHPGPLPKGEGAALQVKRS